MRLYSLDLSEVAQPLADAWPRWRFTILGPEQQVRIWAWWSLERPHRTEGKR